MSVITRPPEISVEGIQRNEPKLSGTSDMGTRYKNAWKMAYKKQPLWRQKEIDKELVSGKLSSGSWNDDFIQLVTSLAESGDPLEV